MSPEELTRLVRRAQFRDAGAFDEIIDLFGPRLYGYFYRICGSADEAEDLLQELFLRVVRTIGHYEHDGRLEAWLFRIATNLVRDRHRRAGRTPAVQSLDTTADDGQPSVSWAAGMADPNATAPPDLVAQVEEVDRVQRALTELPTHEREAVMLRHFSQLSFAEIAEVMSTPLGTALARVHRGLSKLRKLVGTDP